jgi:hypothetical protein
MRATANSAMPLVLAVALATAACGGATAPLRTPVAPPSRDVMSQLWTNPGNTPRDLYWGVGGQKYAPRLDADYSLKGKDETGFSTSFDVVGPDQVEWSAKIGPEAQTEVLLSRILWGLGYHQPPVYYLPSWMIVGEGIERHRESEARFRPKLPQLVREKEFWRWADNPFSGTRELKGLLVVMLMFNSTDLKDDNNSIYTLTEPWDGASRWFVVRDIGAALGETGKLFPKRNWLEGFEKQGFITRIEGEHVEFDYDGRHQELLSMITPADVRWAAERMMRLTDKQWQDAFRTANYAEPVASRFRARIREKIDDGLALRARTDDRGSH